MPINKITAPSEVPASVNDWKAMRNIQEALLLAAQGAQRIVGSNVAKGAVFLVGGATYLADADTAITGTASDYVKLTPSVDGLTLAPSYVADLTGVTWSSAYNGYYDVSGNLYVFDELKALSLGTITTAKLRDIGLKNLAAGWALSMMSPMISLYTGNPGTFDYKDIASGIGQWLIPSGLYMVSCSSTTLILSIYDGSTWKAGTTPNGLICSDGENYKITNSGGSTNRVNYRKLL